MPESSAVEHGYLEGESMAPDKAFAWPLEAVKSKSWREACLRWQVVREAYPQHPAPWVQGARACIELRSFSQAEALLTHALKAFPSNPYPLLVKAELAESLSNDELTDNLYSEAQKRFPDSLAVWLKSADRALAKGALSQAQELNKVALECAPEDYAPLKQRAEITMASCNWEEALLHWRHLSSKFPEHSLAAQQIIAVTNRAGLSVGDHGQENSESSFQSPQKRGGGLGGWASLIWVKALLSLRSETQRSYLSYLWWVLEPLLYMAVYYFAFGVLLNRGGDGYPAFLLTGLIPWMWFMKCVASTSSSILSGQNLMLQVGIPPLVFPLSGLLQVTIKQLPVILLLLVFVAYLVGGVGLHWLSLVPITLVQGLFTLMVACGVAALVPYIRDLKYLVPTGLTLLMFLSGIFYDYRVISPEWQELFLLNPVALILKYYREVLVEGLVPDFMPLIYLGCVSLLGCAVMGLVYKKLRYVFPRLVLQ